MSKMITLKTDKPHRFNKGIILGGISVKFDAFGFTDVMERHTDQLIEAGLIPVDQEDLEKYEELRKQIAENKEKDVPNVDVFDENIKLKKQISDLEIENKKLKELVTSLQSKEEIKVKEVNSENESFISGIMKMKRKELEEACEGFPKEDWKDLNVEELKKYLISKLEG